MKEKIHPKFYLIFLEVFLYLLRLKTVFLTETFCYLLQPPTFASIRQLCFTKFVILMLNCSHNWMSCLKILIQYKRKCLDYMITQRKTTDALPGLTRLPYITNIVLYLLVNNKITQNCNNKDSKEFRIL
jgi:hypothetical protein